MMRSVLVVVLLSILAFSNGTPQDLDTQKLQTMLTKFWQKSLNTGDDPAGGRWYTSGANGDSVGLYGGLSDHINENVNFDVKNKQFTTAQFTATSGVVDNRNGLTNTSTITLSYTHSTSTTQTHTTSSSFKVGLGVSVKASATIFGIGADITTSFSFDYTYGVQTSTSQTESDSTTYTQSVPMKVPKGKVYEAILTGTKQTLTVPTTTITTVTGNTETWFESRVNGHYSYIDDAGDVCQHIHDWGLAGDDSAFYSSSGSQGIITLPGTITGVNAVNFKAQTIDITGMSAETLKAIHDDPSLIPQKLIVASHSL